VRGQRRVDDAVAVLVEFRSAVDAALEHGAVDVGQEGQSVGAHPRSGGRQSARLAAVVVARSAQAAHPAPGAILQGREPGDEVAGLRQAGPRGVCAADRIGGGQAGGAAGIGPAGEVAGAGARGEEGLQRLGLAGGCDRQRQQRGGGECLRGHGGSL
jgi:hypothetical protein